VGHVDAIIYCRTGDADPEVMQEYLRGLSVGCRLRHIDNGDPSARREWEELDGEFTPLLVLDQTRVVRGLDRMQVNQLLGWIGC
jgi:hypothetical protein